MNVQQMKYFEITSLFAALILCALLFAPCAAYANEPTSQQVNGTVAVGQDGKSETPEADKAQAGTDDDATEQNAPAGAPTETQDGTATSDSTTPAEPVAGSGNGQTAPAASVGKEESATAQDAGKSAITTQSTTSSALAAGAASTASTASAASAASTTNVAKVGLSYRARVQKTGWQAAVKAGKTAGTTGKSLRVGGIRINLTNLGNLTGHVRYSVHMQNKGWLKVVADGAKAGSSSKLRVEAIRIWISGDITKHFDVYYRAHVQGKGWMNWVRNGAVAGTTGKGLRLEAFQIRLSAKTEAAAGKGANAVGVRYDAHVQSVGWQLWTGDKATAGTTGKGLRLEALTVRVSPGPYSGGISFQGHVQGKGWQKAVANGKTIGTTGKGLRLEAMRLNLTGDLKSKYNVYYRTHVQNYGWMDWASNGQDSGSTGYGLRIEAVQIVLLKKGVAAPGATKYRTVDQLITTLDGIDISGWQAGINVRNVPADFVIVKATGGKGYINPHFRSMANDTLKSGKLLGLYHYARDVGYEGSAKEEAAHFVNQVKDYVGNAVLVLDWEGDALSYGPGWTKVFLDEVYRLTKVRPLIYMSKSVTRSYDWTTVAKTTKLWVAQYPDYNTTGYQQSPWTDVYGYGAWSAPTIFQYTSSGRLSGYGGNLDLNKFYGSHLAWRKLAATS